MTALSIAAAQPLTPVAPPVPPTAAADTVGADSAAAVPKTRADTVVVAKHHFNHRQQIITGGVIMACLAGIMTVMNNYNPR